jgi:uncharacterized protein YybS (DUF2232 family)
VAIESLQLLALGGFLVSLGVAMASILAIVLLKPLLRTIETQQDIIVAQRHALHDAQQPILKAKEALELSNEILRRTIEVLDSSEGTND